MLRVLRVICFGLSLCFALKAVYPRSDIFRDCMIASAVAILGLITLLVLYLITNHCESDNADKRTKILYGVIRRVLQYIGIVVCSILSAFLGHAVSYSHLAGIRMLDATFAIFFLSFAATFISDFGCIEIFIAWWLSSLCSSKDARDWLGGKLLIRGDDERVKAQLVVIIGIILLVRNISLPVLNFLDEWSWSDDDFWTVIGRVNGHIDSGCASDEGASGGGDGGGAGGNRGGDDVAGNADMTIDIEAGRGRQESAEGEAVEEFFDANDHFDTAAQMMVFLGLYSALLGRLISSD
ncbi:hypothetical protein OROMI_006427 [Orobanche minor]